MSDELKSCPFCGTEWNPSFRNLGMDEEPWWEITCMGDDCLVVLRGFNSKADAIAAWNRRSEDAP